MRITRLFLWVLPFLPLLWISPSLQASPPPRTGRSIFEQLTGAQASAESRTVTPETIPSSGPWVFAEVFSFDLAEYWCENKVAVADFDHDGLKDIALLATTTYNAEPPWEHVSKVILLRNQGDWHFSETVVVEYPENHYGYALRAGDLNNDGWADLVVRESPSTHVLLNDQSGGFSEVWAGRPGYASLDLADVNDDSFLDLLTGTQAYNGGKIEIFLNNGSGTSFTKSWESVLYGGIAGTIRNIFSATLNDDNAPDIVATEIYDGLLATFTGDGTGTSFVEQNVLSLGGRAFGLAVGKVNTDTLTDIAVYAGHGQARLFLAQSDDSLSAYWQSPDLGEAAFNLGLADFDKDGFDDLFVGTFRDGALRIYRNRPATDFALAWSGDLAGNGYTGTIADLNDDGYADLIVGEQDASRHNTIRILRNGLALKHRHYLPLIQK